MSVEILQSWPIGLIWAVVDVAIVAYVFYRLILMIRGTRAVHLVKGLTALFALTAISRRLNLDTAFWLLDKAQVALAVAIPVVFQPELRRALEQVGRGRVFPPSLLNMGEDAVNQLVDEVVRAAFIISRKKHGAIIVLERGTGLNDVAETGIRVDAIVSAEFLVNIFTPNTPLHDGAVILKGNRVLAAACFLPLAESQDLGVEFGSRHRAALGITEHSDALAIVVSEETGSVSLANNGKLIQHLDEVTLKEMLQAMLIPKDSGFNLPLWPGARSR